MQALGENFANGALTLHGCHVLDSAAEDLNVVPSVWVEGRDFFQLQRAISDEKLGDRGVASVVTLIAEATAEVTLVVGMVRRSGTIGR